MCCILSGIDFDIKSLLFWWHHIWLSFKQITKSPTSQLNLLFMNNLLRVNLLTLRLSYLSDWKKTTTKSLNFSCEMNSERIYYASGHQLCGASIALKQTLNCTIFPFELKHKKSPCCIPAVKIYSIENEPSEQKHAHNGVVKWTWFIWYKLHKLYIHINFYFCFDSQLKMAWS